MARRGLHGVPLMATRTLLHQHINKHIVFAAIVKVFPSRQHQSEGFAVVVFCYYSQMQTASNVVSASKVTHSFYTLAARKKKSESKLDCSTRCSDGCLHWSLPAGSKEEVLSKVGDFSLYADDVVL